MIDDTTMQFKKIRFLLLFFSFVFLSSCSGTSVHDDLSANSRGFAENSIWVCYGFGCQSEGLVALSGSQWLSIQKIFQQTAKTPAEERLMIAAAISLMEQLSGEQLGTSNDRAENANAGEPGQMDCIDESKNTSAYLRLFIYKGWIKWHRLQDRVMRSDFFIDVHWTAVIQDKQSKQLYAVDSWFRENGKEPVILKLEDWLAKKERP